MCTRSLEQRKFSSSQEHLWFHFLEAMTEAIAGMIFPIFTRFPTAALLGVKEEGVQTLDMGEAPAQRMCQAETWNLLFLLRFPGEHIGRGNYHVKKHCLIKFYSFSTWKRHDFYLSSLPAAADLQDTRKNRGERVFPTLGAAGRQLSPTMGHGDTQNLPAARKASPEPVSMALLSLMGLHTIIPQKHLLLHL